MMLSQVQDDQCGVGIKCFVEIFENKLLQPLKHPPGLPFAAFPPADYGPFPPFWRGKLRLEKKKQRGVGLTARCFVAFPPSPAGRTKGLHIYMFG
ncbi:hypothetical protein ACFOLJ_21810 [Rugamonas sp. CCM 8940]|uniref:hypothetical protein n=1 Tax=Rugamonas sp. CCM 8940 TaxID=2765359 RepID=UPI0018F65149|nr:hypothetical protein [Rugamonas sp. CCM 8940]MBJ7310671.1 hypothetical protein [Rugamonas sp. CCM 8940]